MSEARAHISHFVQLGESILVLLPFQLYVLVNVLQLGTVHRVYVCFTHRERHTRQPLLVVATMIDFTCLLCSLARYNCLLCSHFYLLIYLLWPKFSYSLRNFRNPWNKCDTWINMYTCVYEQNCYSNAHRIRTPHILHITQMRCGFFAF